MHGDEPSATPALLDIAGYLAAHAGEPSVKLLLENFTLLMIPMLNPDGAETYSRRNAQAIDINRDALNLATPEGRLLKRVRDEYKPMLGFNLHDQDRRTTVGATGRLATIAVLAVSGDAANTLTPGRQRTKRASSAIAEALASLVPGGVARYDEDWSPRAFGDNLTAWGTPVVLIESGGLPSGQNFTQLTRLNFVAILTVLQDLARDDLAAYDPRVYENLPRNQTDAWSDIVVRGGYLLQPGTAQAYRADLAFNQLRSDRKVAGCPLLPASDVAGHSQVVLVGDASYHGAGQSLDASNALLLAPFEVGAKGWSARKWLDRTTLAQLAGLGVGTLYWSVSPRHAEAALAYAQQLTRQGAPGIKVLSGSAGLPGLVLSGRPSTAASMSLHDVLLALGAGAVNSVEALQGLWLSNTDTGLNPPRLRKGQAASFLIASPAPGGHIDFTKTRLVSVWLDGYFNKGSL